MPGVGEGGGGRRKGERGGGKLSHREIMNSVCSKIISQGLKIRYKDSYTSKLGQTDYFLTLTSLGTLDPKAANQAANNDRCISMKVIVI